MMSRSKLLCASAVVWLCVNTVLGASVDVCFNEAVAQAQFAAQEVSAALQARGHSVAYRALSGLPAQGQEPCVVLTQVGQRSQASGPAPSKDLNP
jgi:hypothetical protein